jgi:MscS family membrane protein
MKMGRELSLFVLGGTLFCSIGWTQATVPSPVPATSLPPQPPDVLGRETPRGCVLGFLSAARREDYETAERYLNLKPHNSPRAKALANQLWVVLDRRLPPRLNQLSPQPEGSQYFPTRPDADLVGTIESLHGTVNIVVQRVDQGKNGYIWLFAEETLDAIPELYEEMNLVPVEDWLPVFLTERKIVQIPLFEWLAVLVGMPLVYILTGLLDWLLSLVAIRLWLRFRKHQGSTKFRVLSKPIRLLLLALVIRWMVARFSFSLLSRQFWSGVASIIIIASFIWLMLMLNSWGADWARRRLERGGIQGSISVVGLLRRTADLLVVFGGVLVLLTYFNLNVTAALAGLGVGGIAIALAAQKTLENVIGGISIIADRVVRVGELIKVGTTVGTVEDVGLRSTRIRTQDRTLVSIPNGQISNERLEDVSSRDKFCLHMILSLRYETTAAQVRTVVAAIRGLLLEHARVEPDSVRVRFLRFGPSSLDVDVFVHITVVDYVEFLEIQEYLLLQIMDAVQAAGTRMAVPSQTTYVVSDSPLGESAAMPKVRARQ